MEQFISWVFWCFVLLVIPIFIFLFAVFGMTAGIVMNIFGV